MGGSLERHTTSKGVSCRRGKFSRANGQHLGSQHRRDRFVFAGQPLSAAVVCQERGKVWSVFDVKILAGLLREFF